MDKKHVDLIVIGAGPGGYAAAFFAADHGKKVLLVEKGEALGGVCLNRGCIPSKALLNAAHIISEAKHAAARGIIFSEPKVDFTKLVAWKNSVISKLSSGIGQLAKARNVEVITGKAYFEDSKTVRIETKNGQALFTFENVLIAAGSSPALPAAFDLGNPRVMTSTEALDINELPKKLLVIGGGYIGMELGTVYADFGSEVTMVEATSVLLAGADRDLARPVIQRGESIFKVIHTETKVIKMATKGKSISVDMEKEGKKFTETFDKVLVSVGRTPNSKEMGLENAGIDRDERGFIKVNDRQETSVPGVYAIGDIAGGLLLAHKASKEAKIAVEAILGQETSFDKNIIIPAVVFTDPELAWAGLTEAEAKEKGIAVKVSKFPWGASGRALTLDRPSGLTKLVIDPQTERILGVGIVGPHAGDLIGEGVLAIEMGATATDLAETVHPHPTLSETLMEAAEAFLGHSTHLTPVKK